MSDLRGLTATDFEDLLRNGLPSEGHHLDYKRHDRLGQLRAEIDTWLVDYNTRRQNHSDYMRGRTPRHVLDEHRHKRAS